MLLSGVVGRLPSRHCKSDVSVDVVFTQFLFGFWNWGKIERVLLPVRWQVTSAENGQDIGKITKQWAGFMHEYFTSADQFGVSCKFFRSD